MNRPKVWGWASPWSGDEHDPVPRSYWWWYRLYRWDQRFWHMLRLHDWRVLPAIPPDGRLRYRCDWCGRTIT